MSNTKRGSAADAVLVVFGILAVLGLLAFSITITRQMRNNAVKSGVDTGYALGVEEVRKQAIEAGVAEYYVADKVTGKVAFRFKVVDTNVEGK